MTVQQWVALCPIVSIAIDRSPWYDGAERDGGARLDGPRGLARRVFGRC
jgi:hypothetical protein